MSYRIIIAYSFCLVLGSLASYTELDKPNNPPILFSSLIYWLLVVFFNLVCYLR